MKAIFLSVLFIGLGFTTYAQIGIGTTSPSATAALDIESTTKGLLIPRLTQTQRDAIPSPATGLMIFCTDCAAQGEPQFYNGASWNSMLKSASLLYGTSDPGENTGANDDFFINTTSNQLFGPKASGVWPAGTSLVGPAGANGATGAAGTNGKTVLNGTSNPVAGTGTDGDFYINTITKTFFGPKASGAWPTGTALVGSTGSTGSTGPAGPAGATGSTGAAGTNGKTVLNGTSNPISGIGTDGDFYINTSTNTLFGPKASGAWPTGTLLVGPAGATGATGPAGTNGTNGTNGATGPAGATGATGTAGTNGKTVLNGTSNPIAGTGTDGDFYINTTTKTLFGPKASGAWPTGTALVGSTGSTGATGPTGPAGATGSTGTAGTNGKTVLNGTSNPIAGTGTDGDFYINTTTNTLFGPKASGAWPAGTSLVGPSGIGSASGTTNYVSKFTGTTSLGNSLIYDNGTNVAIGTSNPDSTLTINGTGSSQIRLRSNDENRGFLYVDGTGFALGTSTNIPLNIQTNGSTKMTITQAGDLGIGTISPAKKFHLTGGDMAVDGSIFVGTTSNPIPENLNPKLAILAPAGGDGISLKHLSDGSNAINVWQTGSNIYTALAFSKGDAVNPLKGAIRVSTTNVFYLTSSDYRLKKNVVPLKDGLSRLMQLKPVQYNWKLNNAIDEGFIAHELQSVFPYAVSGNKDEVDEKGAIKPQTVDYGRITPLLVKAIQELQTTVEELKAKIKVLEEK